MPVLSLTLLLVAVPLLGRSADVFVTGTLRVASRYRLAPVLVGAVVIGFGPALPEALASVLAALDGQIDVAVGNVVGSNVANLTLVLGPVSLLCVTAFPASIRRHANGDGFVNNAERGGTVEKAHDPEADALAVAATEALGLWYAGVDIVESEPRRVLEVNALPGFVALEAVTGENPAVTIWAMVRDALAERAA